MNIKKIMPVVAFGALLAVSTAYAADPTAAPASGAMPGSSMQDQSGAANADASTGTTEKHAKHHKKGRHHHARHHHKAHHPKGEKADSKTDGTTGDATSGSSSTQGSSTDMPSSSSTAPAAGQ
jgi:hypothetical protein